MHQHSSSSHVSLLYLSERQSEKGENCEITRTHLVPVNDNQKQGLAQVTFNALHENLTSKWSGDPSGIAKGLLGSPAIRLDLICEVKAAFVRTGNWTNGRGHSFRAESPIDLSVPHGKHITSPRRAQQVNAIYRFVKIVYQRNYRNSEH
jgi:GH24 family phage-related lysozyme (muramidase)